MNNEVLSGIISSGIGLIGLVVGYFYREYQNRVKNLVHIYNIDNHITKLDDPVDIDDKLQDNCSKSELMDKLKKTEKYKKIYENWDTADDLNKFWTDLKSDINKLKNKKNDTDFIVILEKLFENRFFEIYFRKFLFKNKAIDIKTKLNEKKITISDPDKDGNVWIGFPEQDLSFNITNHTAAQPKFKPFLNNVSALDKNNLIKTFERFVIFMDSEYQLAISSINSLKEIKNNQSRWGFYVQISNISSSPFLLELEPKLKIKYKKNEYTIALYTTLIESNPNTGENYLKDTTKPLLLKHNEANELVVITKNREKEMEFGKTIREIFDSKKGTYRIEWKVIKPGLFKRQTLKSSRIMFYD